MKAPFRSQSHFLGAHGCFNHNIQPFINTDPTMPRQPTRPTRLPTFFIAYFQIVGIKELDLYKALSTAAPISAVLTRVVPGLKMSAVRRP